MPSSYSTTLGIELMVTGEKSGTWGDITNTNLNIVEQSQGYVNKSIAGGAQTTALLITDGSTSTSDARNLIIELTGTITGNQIVTVPDGIEKSYIVNNNTSGAFTVQFKTASGTGPTFAATDKGIKIVYSNGTDIVDTGLTAGITEISEDTSPQLGGDLDTNSFDIQFDDAKGIRDDADNEQLIFQKVASAVNYMQIYNASTGTNPTLNVAGDDTNIGLEFSTKGTGLVKFNDAVYNAEVTLTDGATIDWAVNSSPVAKVTLGGNRTINAPTGGATGQFVSLLVIQDGTGSRTLTWNAVYEFASDTAPTLTTTANKGDLFVFRYNGTKWLEVGRNQALTLS